MRPCADHGWPGNDEDGCRECDYEAAQDDKYDSDRDDRLFEEMGYE